MEAYDKGKTFEQKVARLLRTKLGARVQRDSRSGAGYNKSDISDYYNDIPLHLEVKNQQTVNIKEWFRQADATSSFSKAPTVVFAMDEEILCCLRFTDLINFMIEIADDRAEIDDLRQPVAYQVLPKPQTVNIQLSKVVQNKTEASVKTCKEGHITDVWGYCLQKGCKYSSGYKKPKGKDNKK